MPAGPGSRAVAQTRFEILFHPGTAATPITLAITSDPNAATLAYHEAIGRLRERGAVGDVVMRKPDEENALLFRHPVGLAAQPGAGRIP
jgi:hypothetical protein